MSLNFLLLTLGFLNFPDMTCPSLHIPWKIDLVDKISYWSSQGKCTLVPFISYYLEERHCTPILQMSKLRITWVKLIVQDPSALKVPSHVSAWVWQISTTTLRNNLCFSKFSHLMYTIWWFWWVNLEMCNHQHNLVLEHFHHSQRSLLFVLHPGFQPTAIGKHFCLLIFLFWKFILNGAM
jgi:hypothetical protein